MGCRLKQQNRRWPTPGLAETMLRERGSAIRHRYATAIVVLVFVPLFAPARHRRAAVFALGVAYIASILASMIVSMTVTLVPFARFGCPA